MLSQKSTLIDGRLDEAAARLEQAVAALDEGEPDAVLAGALAQLGRMHVLAGHRDAGVEPLERALQFAERLQLPDVFIDALTSKAIVLVGWGRPGGGGHAPRGGHRARS